MGKNLRQLILSKRLRVALVAYLLGVVTMPLLQLLAIDAGQVVLIVVPPILIVIATLIGVQSIVRQTLLQYQDLQQRKQIMRDILSHHPTTVADAMTLLTERNWHFGAKSFLQGLNAQSVNWANLHLNGANLQNADLFRANLDNIWLEHANLRGANISMATLQDAQLSYADMTDGKFMTSDLRGVNLHGAVCHNARLAHSNLSGAILMGTDLRGADLTRVNLQGVRFIQYAKFDKETILPTAKLVSRDGKKNKIVNLNWHADFDWTVYQTGEAYLGYSDEWKEQMNWVNPASLPAIDEDVQSFLA